VEGTSTGPGSSDDISGSLEYRRNASATARLANTKEQGDSVNLHAMDLPLRIPLLVLSALVQAQLGRRTAMRSCLLVLPVALFPSLEYDFGATGICATVSASPRTDMGHDDV
jgi:hypothetical protein